MLRQTVARLACITHQWSDTGWQSVLDLSLHHTDMSYNNRPPSTGYGVPQAPPLDGNSFGSSYYPPSNLGSPAYLYRGLWLSIVSILPNYLVFPGYEDDIYLLVKLGEAAIIIFIIFALVAIIYMIVNCCVSFSGRNKWNLFYFYLFCLRSFLVCYIWSINPLFFLLVFDISGSCNFPN